MSELTLAGLWPEGIIAATDAHPVEVLAVVTGASLSVERWSGRVRLSDGRTVFVKTASTAMTVGWLTREIVVYSSVQGPFLPRLVGSYRADGRAVLVLEDLGRDRWPPPWHDGDVSRVRDMLEHLHATPPAPEIGDIADCDEFAGGWDLIAKAPRQFLALGLCGPDWLDMVLPTLLDAAEAAPLAGVALVHMDVRSDNLCLSGDRSYLVDWNWASVGNPDLDLVMWLPSLHDEGGPRPDDLAPAGSAPLVTWFTGLIAARAGRPGFATAPGVRPTQLRQLRIALPWMARALHLPAP